MGMSNLIRDVTEEEPSGSSTLVAQEGEILFNEVFTTKRRQPNGNRV
jgi:hypothetical protein